MAKINHNISAPNDGLGDQLRTAFGNQNAMNTELYEAKVDKVNGKGLSTNDYTNIDKAKVDAIVVGAEINVQSDWAQGDNTKDDYIKNKPTDLDFSGLEVKTNKQDSLTADGTGSKYPTVDAVSGALGLKEDKSNKNTANGYAGLGTDGKLISSQLPSITVTDTFVVANQTAMLAIVGQTGDVAVRTDLNKSFILKGTNPTILADWQELLTPTDAVQSFNSRTGTILPNSGDYTADQITETATRVFQTPTQRTNNDATSSIQTQLNGKAPTTGSSNYIQNGTTQQTANLNISGSGTFGSSVTAASVNLNNVLSVVHAPNSDYLYLEHPGAQAWRTRLTTDNTSSYVIGNDLGGAFANKILTLANSGAATFNSSVTAASFNGGAALTGTPTAPTATAGTNTTQIATTAFVLATTNSNALLLTGDQNFTGTKSSTITGANTNSISLTNESTGTGSAAFFINVSATGSQNGQRGMSIYNNNAGGAAAGSQAVYIDNNSSGTGIQIKNYSNGTGVILQNAGGTGDLLQANGATITSNGLLKLKNYTVSTLPSGVQGATAYVTDATSPTYLGTLTGGGSVKCPVFFNGTSWVSH